MAYKLNIEDFDRMPRLARQALANSLVLGTGSDRLYIKRAKAAVMVERIQRADAMLVKDNNTIMPGANLRAVIAVLNGLA